MRMFNCRFLKVFILLCVSVFITPVYTQSTDSCSIGIPHERFWLIKRVDLTSINQYKDDFRKGRFHQYRASIVVEIDSILKQLERNILEIRKNGYSSVHFFESIEYDVDTIESKALFEQELSKHRKIRGKINSDKKISEHEALYLFKTLFKKYSNVFKNTGWIKTTGFELNFITDYFDTSVLIQKTQNAFIDSIATEKKYTDFSFKKIYIRSTIYSYNSSKKNNLSFDINTYYFPTFQEYFHATHPCVQINQKRLDMLSSLLMNEYLLICSPRFY